MSVKGSRCEAAFFYRSTDNGQQTTDFGYAVPESLLRFCRAYGTFIVYGFLIYRHSALRAPYLPGNCRPFRTFFN